MKKIFLAVFVVFSALIVYVFHPLDVSASGSKDTSGHPITSAPFMEMTGNRDGATLLSARISGLVCDLCVDGIEKDLQGLAGIAHAKAFPRDGVVFMELKSLPEASQVSRVLIEHGYAVHDLHASKGLLKEAIKNPVLYSKEIWTGGLSEQEKLMENPENRKATCEKKTSFASYASTNAWVEQSSEITH